MAFIARASEGGISMDWLMTQPIFVRKDYYKQFQDIIKKREEEASIHNNSSSSIK